ncbi:DoxX family protein [Mucilaginibacter sp. UR6-1]|uniref:DoxX family protein n=1 Tax=Mucilaginibacter sp. UR6-1 TaxID=1435643 RepID=UPI001E38F906|nr:DoxX family protein [Mucilaginibacter sp. UR6-1]MCC8409701.1 DoxX family protein [Mucilaginibacter sp. UR6-1]
MKKAALILMIIGYALAGINHFISPASYIKIIPPYLPFPEILNLLAGIFEIFFAALLIPASTRRFSAYGIILMLIAFLPVHISMVANAPLQLGSLNVTPLLAWVRLIILQPLLIAWAWWCGTANQSLIKQNGNKQVS